MLTEGAKYCGRCGQQVSMSMSNTVPIAYSEIPDATRRVTGLRWGAAIDIVAALVLVVCCVLLWPMLPIGLPIASEAQNADAMSLISRSLDELPLYETLQSGLFGDAIGGTSINVYPSFVTSDVGRAAFRILVIALIFALFFGSAMCAGMLRTDRISAISLWVGATLLFGNQIMLVVAFFCMMLSVFGRIKK